MQKRAFITGPMLGVDFRSAPGAYPAGLWPKLCVGPAKSTTRPGWCVLVAKGRAPTVIPTRFAARQLAVGGRRIEPRPVRALRGGKPDRTAMLFVAYRLLVFCEG